MENWLEIYRTEREARNSFLISHRHITQNQVYRMESLFERIERVMTRIKNVLAELKTSRFKQCTKNKLREEAIRLVTIYESLRDMVDHNKGLADRFVLDIAKLERNVARILEDISILGLQ